MSMAMRKKATGVGVIGLAVVLLTIGGLMMVFEFGDDIIAKLFLIAGAVAAAASFAGLVLSLVMTPVIIRYAIAGIAIIALILGAWWFFYNKTEWGEILAGMEQDMKQIAAENERLKEENAHLRGREPAAVTVTVTLRETEESTVFVDSFTTISVSSAVAKTITVELPAMTVTEVAQAAPVSTNASLHRRIERLESELRLKEIELGVKRMKSSSEDGGENTPSVGKADPTPEIGEAAPASPPADAKPKNSEQSASAGAAGGKQGEFSVMTESQKEEIRAIREQLREKQEENPDYKPTTREKRASQVADLLEKITDSFELVVLRVKDGDTFVGVNRQDSTTTMTVRLSAIDAPEMHDPWGDGAKSFLINALGGDSGIVRVKPLGFDNYGRLIAVVFRKGVINESIVRQGRARLVERYCSEYNQVSSCDNLIKAQDEARKNGKGIWGERPPSRGILGGLLRFET